MSKTEPVGRAQAPKQAAKRVNFYFRQHPNGSLRTGAVDLGFPYSTIQIFLEKVVYMFLYKIAKIRQVQPHDSALKVAFSQSPMDCMSSCSGFLCYIVFHMNLFSVSVFANIQNTRILGQKTQQRFNNMN